MTALPQSHSLPDDKRKLLHQLVEGLDALALQYISGFAAGLAAAASTTLKASSLAPDAATSVTVLYGTQSGNSRALAERFSDSLRAAGLTASPVRASDFPVRSLSKTPKLVVIISTQGDGDPPEDSRDLWDFLHSPRAPKLDNVKFAVLALGDSSYPKFCHVGRVIDARLEQLGAQRLLERGECDVDFEGVAAAWLGQAVDAFRGQSSDVTLSSQNIAEPARATTSAPSKTNPAIETVLLNQRIVGRNARKEVRHLELTSSQLSYQPGDALSVWPEQAPWLVGQVLKATGLDAQESVVHQKHTRTLSEWLTSHCELTRLARPTLQTLVEGNQASKSTDAAQFTELLQTHQLIDALQAFPRPWTAKQLVSALRPLVPRAYSIASSPLRFPDEVHLTVAHVDYQAFGARHVGAASHFLSEAREAQQLRVFIEPNERFRLPKALDADIVMIGPGTGVAPFRAFVQHRAELGATGRNWLFFGEQYFGSQFLYQLEWQAALKKGELSALDVAFSRDQPQKVYVQDRMRQRGAQLYDWLQNGAFLYVCGDAKRMAPDVEAALHDIARLQGNLSDEQATEWLAQLRSEGRYVRDVY
jgi:sulfite reductase (NADPH) flavoprotein alpha-component